ncbi:MAG TPA: hypothetical protein VJH68_05405 [Candidatus Nanoarchaeia archaeon]|nr:hypothetical protein [Candidatus Nanoarchaeia archaeon]
MQLNRLVMSLLASWSVSCSSQVNVPSMNRSSPKIDYQLERAAKYLGARILNFADKVEKEGQCYSALNSKVCSSSTSGKEYFVNVEYRDLDGDGSYDRLEVHFFIPPNRLPVKTNLILQDKKIFVAAPGELADVVQIRPKLYLYRKFIGDIILYNDDGAGGFKEIDNKPSYPCFDALGRQLPFQDDECVPPEY